MKRYIIDILCALLLWSASCDSVSALFGGSSTPVATAHPQPAGECLSKADKGAIKQALVKALDGTRSGSHKAHDKDCLRSLGTTGADPLAALPAASPSHDPQANYHGVLEALVDKSMRIKADQLALVHDAKLNHLKQCALNRETQQVQAEHAAELQRQQALINKLRDEGGQVLRLEHDREQSLIQECAKTRQHESQVESLLASELQAERAQEGSMRHSLAQERCREKLMQQTAKMQLLSEKRHSRALQQQICELKEVQKQLEKSINCEVAKEAALRRVAKFETDAEKNLQKLIHGEEDREDKLEKRLLEEVNREKSLAKKLACTQKLNQDLRHRLNVDERAVTQLREEMAMREAQMQQQGLFPRGHSPGHGHSCPLSACSKPGCQCHAGVTIKQVHPDRSKTTLVSSPPPHHPPPLPGTETVKTIVVESVPGSSAPAKVYQSASVEPPPGTKYEVVIDGAASGMHLPAGRVQAGTPEWRAAFEAIKHVSHTGGLGPRELAHLQQDLHGSRAKLLAGESAACNECSTDGSPHALKHCGHGEIYLQGSVPYFGALRVGYRDTKPCGHYRVYVNGNVGAGLEVDGLAMESMIAGFESLTGYWTYREGMDARSLIQSPAEFAVDINAGVLYDHRSVRFLKNPISSFSQFSEIVLAAEHVPTVTTPLEGSDLEIDTTLARFYTRLFNLRSSALYFNDHWSLMQGTGPAVFYIKKNKHGALVAHGPKRQSGQSDKLAQVVLNVASSSLTAIYASDHVPVAYRVPGSSIRLIKLLAHISGWPIQVAP